MPGTFDLLFPRFAQLDAVLALAVVALLAIGLGRLVSGEARPAAALVAGWGAAVFAYVAVGTLTPLPLRAVAGVLAVLGVVGVALLISERRRAPASWCRAGRVLVLALPLILLAAGMRASQWDELSHWLPNARFLAAYDHFPSLAEPNPDSQWPAYPYALPLIAYMSSIALGRFSDRVGILFNLLLLLALAAAIADLLAGEKDTARGARWREWGRAASALLVAVALNPSFVPKLALSNYSDSATSCVLAVAAIAAVRAIAGWRGGQPSRNDILVCGWSLTVLVSLRQANLTLFALFLVGLAMCLFGEAAGARRRAGVAVLALLPAIVTAFLWRRYVALEIATGEFHLLPFAQWRVDAVGTTVRSMLRVVVDKGMHFALMAAVCGVALASPWRARIAGSEARALCRIAAIMFVGYSGFLLFAYVATSFSDSEARAAASFWRYSTHLGGIGLIAAVAVIAPRLRAPRRTGPALAAAAVALVVLLPAVEVRHLRFDVAHPHDGYLLAVSRELSALVPASAPLALLDFHHNGSNLVLVRYALTFDRSWPGGGVRRRLAAHAQTDASAAARAAQPGDYLWIDEGGPELALLFALDLPGPASYLLVREEAGFRFVRTWPVSRETEVFAAADFD